jgi:DNA-binding CsgD family transcriptional regulator
MALVFFISRYKKQKRLGTVLFLIILIASFSFHWFYAGGSAGPMLYNYFILLTTVVFIFERQYRIWVLGIILLNISVLFIVEVRFPEIILQTTGATKLFKYLYFLAASLITFAIVQSAKTLYRVHYLDYRKLGSEECEYDIEKLLTKLSNREKEVFDLMLLGKKNGEIAELLYIDICTVKSHINNIYKKIGVFDRTNMNNGSEIKNVS